MYIFNWTYNFTKKFSSGCIASSAKSLILLLSLKIERLVNSSYLVFCGRYLTEHTRGYSVQMLFLLHEFHLLVHNLLEEVLVILEARVVGHARVRRFCPRQVGRPRFNWVLGKGSWRPHFQLSDAFQHMTICLLLQPFGISERVFCNLNLMKN